MERNNLRVERRRIIAPDEIETDPGTLPRSQTFGLRAMQAAATRTLFLLPGRSLLATQCHMPSHYIKSCSRNKGPECWLMTAYELG